MSSHKDNTVMNDAGMSDHVNKRVRILTDIQILQSPRWCRETDYLPDSEPVGGMIDRLPQKLQSILIPLIRFIQIARKAKDYEVVITANIKVLQLFGIYRRLLRLRSPRQVVLELMLDEVQDTIVWRMKRFVQCIAFAWVDIIFVSARDEVETYSRRFNLPTGRVRYLPFHTDIIQPRIFGNNGGYILAAGRTGRDYETLADAVKDINEKVIIVSDRYSIENIKFPPNVELMTDIPYEKYIDLMTNCRFVVVPLKRLVKSTGQVVILEAMGLGKPVIATRTTGTVDYIQHGVNGLLCPPGDAGALSMEIVKLSNDKILFNKIAANALESVMREHTFEVYFDRVLKAATEITEG